MQGTKIKWLAWPFAAIGLSSILDALPKLGKTRFFLEGIHASQMRRPFLNFPTQPMRVVYVSEQSAASLAMQAREVGFTGDEVIGELRWIAREHWSRFVFTDFLERFEKEFLAGGEYNALVFDTWHTIARLEDESDASEVNRVGNLTIDVATSQKVALTLGRHDRKSGADVGLSGRSSIQLSGLVDVILHLTRVAGDSDSKRKLELAGRVPGLSNKQIIELVNGEYTNLGEPAERDAENASKLEALLKAEPTVSYRTINHRTGISKNRIKRVTESIGWNQGGDGQWRRGSGS
jgi:hypothetical protein